MKKTINILRFIGAIIRKAINIMARMSGFEWAMSVWFIAALNILATYAKHGDDVLWFWLLLTMPLFLLFGYYSRGEGRGRWSWTNDLLNHEGEYDEDEEMSDNNK